MSVPPAVGYVAGALLAAHGIAHVVGFAIAWRLLTSTDLPYKTTLLAGRLDVGAAGIRLVGLLWLTLAASFVVVGVLTIVRGHISVGVVAAVAAASAILCLIEWPQARIGLFVNLGVLAALSAFRALR